MSETFEINERNQVVPYTAGRKCTDTRAWRDATELELQQQEQISQLERELAEARGQIEANHEATLAIERMVYDARAQRDTLLAALIHVRKGWGGMIVDPGCDCEDCVYLRPIDEAIAAAKIFNHEKP